MIETIILSAVLLFVGISYIRLGNRVRELEEAVALRPHFTIGTGSILKFVYGDVEVIPHPTLKGEQLSHDVSVTVENPS